MRAAPRAVLPSTDAYFPPYFMPHLLPLSGGAFTIYRKVNATATATIDSMNNTPQILFLVHFFFFIRTCHLI